MREAWEVLKKLYWLGKFMRDHEVTFLVYHLDKRLIWQMGKPPEIDLSKPAEYEQAVRRGQ